MKSLIYAGKIRHRRFTPKEHKFSYKLFMFCFDIAAIDTVFKGVPFVSIEGFNWFAFKRKNYLSHPEIPLDKAARELVKEKYNIYPQGKIYLLTHLSCLNYCFNPISLYFVFNKNNDELDFLIVEVTNTPWGEKHAYVLADPEKPKKDIYRYHFQKKLHVSPFMTMDYEYRFNLKLANDRIIVHMGNYQEGNLHFDATLTLLSVPTKAAEKIFLSYPLITFKVTAAIHWQALRLWLKGVLFQSHPKIK
jgi:uncharacterized protein